MILRITYEDGFVTERPVEVTWVCCGNASRVSTVEIVDRDVPAPDALWFGVPVNKDISDVNG